MKFARYLPDFGWSPTVLTCREGGGLPLDDSLEREIPERLSVERVTDPMGRLRRRRGPGSGGKPGKGGRLRQAAARMVRFVPGDYPAWTVKVLGRGKSLIRRRDFEVIYSTSSPPDNHLIAWSISRRNGIPWVADFRDPWTGNYLYDKSWPTGGIERLLEKRVIQQADAVVTVSEPISESYRNFLPTAERCKVVTIPNGFDPADFENIAPEPADDGRIMVVYCGNFDSRHRPTRFLEALAILLKDRPELRHRLRVRFIGAFPSEDRNLAIGSELGEIVSLEGYRPYKECLAAQAGADILLFIIYSGPGAQINLSGKIYQYLGLRKPILGIAPEGEAKKLLTASGTARLADPGDVKGIAVAMSDLIDDRLAGVTTTGDEGLIESFGSPALAGRLAEVFNRIVGGRG